MSGHILHLMNNKHTTILKCVVGSKLYGTNTETSDTDLMSVVIAPKSVYLGLDHWGNSGTIEEKYDDPLIGFVEHNLYEVKKFIGLLQGFNPNVIPALYSDDYQILTDKGKLLLANRNIFNSKKAYHTFIGFSHSQLSKMGGIFNDNLEENTALKNGFLLIEQELNKKVEDQRNKRDNKSVEYDSGYLNAVVATRSFVKEEQRKIKLDTVTGRMGAKRKELRDLYGFDCKYLQHTIRLMKTLIDFLKDPKELKVNRKGIDADLLIDIRYGKYTKEQGKALADELFQEANELLPRCDLPDEPDYERINDFCIEILS